MPSISGVAHREATVITSMPFSYETMDALVDQDRVNVPLAVGSAIVSSLVFGLERRAIRKDATTKHEDAYWLRPKPHDM